AAIEIEGQSFRARRGLGAGEHLRAALGATELPRIGLAQRDGFGPGLGVEQERMPVQFDLGRRIAQQRQRALEPALADPAPGADHVGPDRSEEHTSELQSRENLVCRLLLEKKKNNTK